MILGRVTGTVVAPSSTRSTTGERSSSCAYCNPDGTFDGDKYVVAVDLVGAGTGETVLVEDEGNSARQLVGVKDAPIRSVIIGIVDDVTHDGE